MIILTDADDVLENLTEEVFRVINERYGTSARYEDIRDWDLSLCFPTLTREQVYGVELEPSIYSRLRPMEGAPDALRRLMAAGHEVLVCTATPYPAVAPKMRDFMSRYFPFLSWRQFINTYRKPLIRGDVLIDDGIFNLEGGCYHKLLFSAPYNEAYDAAAHGMIRVRSWAEIEEIIPTLSPVVNR